MKITKIEIQKKNKNRYSIYVDDEFYIGVDQDIILKHSIKTNMEIDKEFLNNVLKSEEKQKAINTACNYLGFKPRSEKEVIDKLKVKGFDDEIISNTIDFLYKYKHLDDFSYGKALINDKKAFKKAGKNLLKQELYKKGIGKDLIDDLIEETYDYDEEYKMGYEVALKKYKSIKHEDKNSIYRKLYSLLGRKGYTFEIINKVIKDLCI